MNKMMTAYLLKSRGTVVTDISLTKGEEFEEISLLIPMHEIMEWAEEIDMLGLNEDDEYDDEDTEED